MHTIDPFYVAEDFMQNIQQRRLQSLRPPQMEADVASTQTSTPKAKSACESLSHMITEALANLDPRSILG
jgi:hypothetical protein